MSGRYSLVGEGLQAHAAWACYFLLGAGLLAPWNAFITAVDYFGAVYPAQHIDRVFTLCYLPACLITLGAMMVLSSAPATTAANGQSGSNGRKQLLSRRQQALQGWLSFVANLRTRIIVSYSCFFGIMLLVPLLDRMVVPTDRGGTDDGISPPQAPSFALGVVCAAVVFVGVLDGLCQGAVFTAASKAGPQYTHAVVGGTAVSGLLVCLMRLVTKAAWPQDSPPQLRKSTALYFGLGAVLSLGCLICYTRVLPELEQGSARGSAGGSRAGRRRRRTRMREPKLHTIEEGEEEGEEEEEEERAQHGGELELMADTRSQAHDTEMTRLLSWERGNGPSSSTSGSGAAAAAAIVAAPEHSHSVYVLDEEDEETVMREALLGASSSAGAAAGAAADALVDKAQANLAAASSVGCGIGSGSTPASAGGSAQAAAVAGPGQWQAWRHDVLCCWRCLWQPCCTLLLTYGITLSIFPGFLAEDVHSEALGSWWPITLITLFNLGDFIGKNVSDDSISGGLSLGALLSLCWSGSRGSGSKRGGQGGGTGSASSSNSNTAAASPTRLLLCAGARVAFVPAFLAATAFEAPGVVMVGLTLALGGSNGYLTARAMVLGPTLLPNTIAYLGDDLLVISLVTGLNIGAMSGWLWLLGKG